MRAAESAALALGVTTPPPALIGVAAGTILDPGDRERMVQAGIVIWLRAGAMTLEARASGVDHRPWLDAGGAAWMRDAVAERDPLYASVADVVVDTGAQAAEASATEILEELAAVPACRAALSPGVPRAPRP